MLEGACGYDSSKQLQMSALEVAQESHFLIKQTIEALRIHQCEMLKGIQLQYHA